MRKNPLVLVGAILVAPQGIASELIPVRLRTLSGICRKLIVSGVPDQVSQGRQLLRRLAERTGRPFSREVILGAMMAAGLCGRQLDTRVRAVIAVVDPGVDPKRYPVRIIRDPVEYDLADPDGVAALVSSLVGTADGEAPPVSAITPR